jgi:hypothetical protein
MLLRYTRSTNHSSEKERGKAGLLLKNYRMGNSSMAVLGRVNFRFARHSLSIEGSTNGACDLPQADFSGPTRLRKFKPTPFTGRRARIT